MSQQPTEAPAKKRKLKNFAQINGACKMAKLSDGLKNKKCPHCGTVSKLSECGFCHKPMRGKK